MKTPEEIKGAINALLATTRLELISKEDAVRIFNAVETINVQQEYHLSDGTVLIEVYDFNTDSTYIIHASYGTLTIASDQNYQIV